jgi:hypothetical protein
MGLGEITVQPPVVECSVQLKFACILQSILCCSLLNMILGEILTEVFFFHLSPSFLFFGVGCGGGGCY